MSYFYFFLDIHSHKYEEIFVSNSHLFTFSQILEFREISKYLVKVTLPSDDIFKY